MKAAIASFEFVAVARTRDECVELLENSVLNTVNFLGGAPWVAITEQYQKEHAPQALIADEQGFYWKGQKILHFQGPILAGPGTIMHDNNTIQFQVVDE